MTKHVACAMLAAVATLSCSRESPEPAAAVPYESAAYEDLQPEEQALVDHMLEKAKDRDGQYEVFEYAREIGYHAAPHAALAELHALLACENPAVLEALMQRGTGSVRLYALNLMKDRGHERLDHWMGVLRKDSSPVTMSTGCTMWFTTIAGGAPLASSYMISFRPSE